MTECLTSKQQWFNVTKISWFSDFPLCLKIIWCINNDILGLCQYNLVLDLKIKVGHCDLYFMVH